MKLLNFLRKKNKASASIDALMVFCVSLVVFMVVIVIILSAFSQINDKWKISQCAREYLLIAESQGCLTDSDVQSMKTRLNAYGLENVDTSGTTMIRQDYGDPVVVSFSGTYTGNRSAVRVGGNIFKRTTIQENVSVTRRSTAKW